GGWANPKDDASRHRPADAPWVANREHHFPRPELAGIAHCHRREDGFDPKRYEVVSRVACDDAGRQRAAVGQKHLCLITRDDVVIRDDQAVAAPRRTRAATRMAADSDEARAKPGG